MSGEERATGEERENEKERGREEEESGVKVQKIIFMVLYSHKLCASKHTDNIL